MPLHIATQAIQTALACYQAANGPDTHEMLVPAEVVPVDDALWVRVADCETGKSLWVVCYGARTGPDTWEARMATQCDLDFVNWSEWKI